MRRAFRMHALRLVVTTLLLASGHICSGRAVASPPNDSQKVEVRSPAAEQLSRGRKLLQQMEDAGALVVFDQVLAQPGLSTAQRAETLVLRGVAQANLLDFEAAEQSFAEALRRDPSVVLPPGSSPKIARLFEKARVRQQPAGSLRGKPPTSVAPVSGPDRRSVQRSSINWPAWATAGVAVAAGATGLALGLVARSTADDANDLTRPYDEAQVLHDRASARALAANVLFGVAGAAAVTSVVLFLLKGRDESAATQTAATLLPTAGGASVGLTGVSW